MIDRWARRGLGLAAVAVALGGCGDDPMATVTDAGSDVGATDAGVMDAGSDAGATDAGPDAASEASVDAGDAGAATCNSVPVEELETVATRMGATLRYEGDNSAARASSTAGVQGPDTIAACNFTTTYQRVFHYTLRAAASLRVSTNNEGTDETFDTTVQVLPSRTCVRSPRLVYCNDDDPAAAGMTRRLSSTVITPVLPAGSEVHIAVGGLYVAPGTATPGEPQGSFELTVEELAPIANGAMCDRSLRTTAGCVEGHSCVPSSITGQTGVCRPFGSTAGAQCVPAMVGGTASCATGFTCDTTYNICYRTVATGAGCDRFLDGWERCGADATCTNPQTGSVRGTCLARGSALFTDCGAMNTCAMGLACTTAAMRPICARPADMGACSTADTLCPDGQGCAPTNPGQLQGTCVALGSQVGGPCTAAGACSAGLTCNTTSGTCINTTTTGMPCSIWTGCPTGNTCYLTYQADRSRGTCFAAGTEGGPCNATGAACGAGLTCSNATTPASGRCLRTLAAGMPCEVSALATARCATGNTCVRTDASPMGTCRADGTAAGTACRAATMTPRCDAGLTCTSMTAAGICQAEAVMGACDPRTVRVRCPDGQSCRAATPETGTCAAPAMEAEPNDLIAMATAITGGAGSVRGALSVYDTDCYRVEVPSAGRVFARAAAPSGLCYTGTVLALDLYDPSGRLLGSNTSSGPFGGCPMIDGADVRTPPIYTWARDLPAGRYALCVRNPQSGRAAVGDYVLDVNATSAP